MTAVTFGARSVGSLRAFYRAIGWQENDGSDDTFTSFTMGSARLALYPIGLLHGEAAPGETVVASDSWNGTTRPPGDPVRLAEGPLRAVVAGWE